MARNKALTIFLTASGTGGHLFPAVYICDFLKENLPDVNIIAIGSGRPLEKKIFSTRNLIIETIETVGIKNRGIKGIFQFIFYFPKSILTTIKLFLKYKPDVVIGMGGYATVFPVVFSWFFGIPSWIHEAELSPGLANWFLSFFATKISVAFNQSKNPIRNDLIITGHPVRPGLTQISKKVLNTPVKNLLILGGSQGAQGLDEASDLIAKLAIKFGLNVIHQCRTTNIEKVKGSYSQNGLDAKVIDFIDDMIQSYKWADILISRSGAGSVMEAAVVNIPTIFVPFPFSQGDHQKANAMILVKAGKALISDERTVDFRDSLSFNLEKLCSQSEYNQMILREYDFRGVDAAKLIAKGVVNLLGCSEYDNK